jgi:hypothetical protein
MDQIKKYDVIVVEMPDEKISTKFVERQNNFIEDQFQVVI